MPHNRSFLPILSLLASLLILAGCGGSTPTLAPVTGTVNYLGRPVPGGTIVFTPDPTRGGRGPLAHAEIQPDGKFTLSSGDAPGAVVGWHRVTVLAVQDAGPSAAGQGFLIPRSLLPEKYRSPDLSGLAREIKAGQANVVNIDLE
jgi:hypothetical protein